MTEKGFGDIDTGIPDKKPEYSDKTVLPEKLPLDTSTSRKAAMITLSAVRKFTDLNADDVEASDAKFYKLSKVLWKKLTVHGIYRDGKLMPYTDLDGDSALGLLKIAGIKTGKINYVKPGDFEQGRINIDTGNKDGLVVEDSGDTAFMDHHDKESGSDTSATKITYEVLKSLGFLNKKDFGHLDRLVEFVTQADNKSFPDQEKYFQDSYRTVLGLQRFIKFPKLLQFFKDGGRPTEILDKVDLKELGLIYRNPRGKLINRSLEQKKIIDFSFDQLDRMKKNGFIVDSPDYGEIAVDVGKKVPAGYDAAVANGCGAYIIWTPDTNSFFISTKKDLKHEFPKGKKIRDTMWIHNTSMEESDLFGLTLREVLMEITNNKLKESPKLKEYMDEEEGEISVAEVAA